MADIAVVQATAWYPPFGAGGTEFYVEALVAELARTGIGAKVLVPCAGSADANFHLWRGVDTYPVNEVAFPGEIRSGAAHLGFDDFVTALRRHAGAIYHQHSWTRGCGPRHLRAARQLGFRTVLTVHTPGNLCLRGTMLRFGATACDGRVEAAKCAACWAHGRGLPRGLAQLVARVPAPLSRRALAAEGRLATALSARALVERNLRQIARMCEDADRVVAVCQWLYDALLANGAPKRKLSLSRQGVSAELAASPQRAPRAPGPLDLLVLSRWDPAKGVETAVRAVRALPAGVPVRLRIHAIPAAGPGEAYERRVRALAGDDPRIVFAPPAPHDDLAGVFGRADALLAPSTWLETGPLTVLEAQAAGLFVLGSRRGGIAELVDEADAGELVEAEDVGAWTAAIARLAERKARGELPRRRRRVRAMADVARDMIEVYRSLG